MAGSTKKYKIDSRVVQNILLGNKAFLIVVGMCIVLSIAVPVFATSNNLINIVRQVCVSTLLSIGFTVVLASGHMDLSVGTLLGLSGVILATLMTDYNVAIFPAIVITLIIAVLCGLGNALLITKFGLSAFVVTLATQSIFRGAAYLMTSLKPIAGLPEDFVFIGQGYVGMIPVPVIIMLCVVFAVWVLMSKTKFGRYVVAMGGNITAARTSGVSITRMIYGVFGISGLCAGIAGVVMTARTASAQVGAGYGMEMDAIAAVVIGGTSLAGGNANVWGTLFGCLVVGIVNNGLNLLGIDSNWQIIAKGVLILIAVIIDTLSTRAYNARMNRQLSSSIANEESDDAEASAAN